MSTIRPLATVAILAALGVFLAVRIQQRPMVSTAELTGEWDEAPSFGAEGAATPDTTMPGAAPMVEAPAFDSPGITPMATPPATPSSPPALAPAMPAPPTGDLVPPPLPTLPASPGEASNTPATSPAAVDPNTLSFPDLPLPANIPASDIPRRNHAATRCRRTSDNGDAAGFGPGAVARHRDVGPNNTARAQQTPLSEPWSPPVNTPPVAASTPAYPAGAGDRHAPGFGTTPPPAASSETTPLDPPPIDWPSARSQPPRHRMVYS